MTAMISLWLKPMAEQRVETLFRDQHNLTEFDTLIPGRFQTLTSGKRVTYTEGISDEGELARVFINDYKEAVDNEPREAVTVIADSGKTQVDGAGRRFLVLNNGRRYQGKPGEKNYQSIEYEEYGQLVVSGASIRGKKRRTAIPTSELFGATDAKAVSELHWRVGVVLLIPVIALLAIPLARVNPRQGRFTRLVPAMILCFVYILALSGARTALEKGDIPLDLGLWWIHGIALGTTFLMYRLEWMGEKLNNLPMLFR